MGSDPMDVKEGNPIGDAMMTRFADFHGMRFLLPVLLLCLPVRAEEAELPANVAAAHPEGKWEVRTGDLYRYLARYNSGQPAARAGLIDYVKSRLVEDEARRRKIGVSDAEIDAWLKKVDKLAKTKEGRGLGDISREYEMKPRELRRRARLWILQEKVARAIYCEKDPTRSKDDPVGQDAVMAAIDEIFAQAEKVTDPRKLPKGVVVRIRGIDIKEYEFGRVLAIVLPFNEVARALGDLILTREVVQLTGSDEPPTKEELENQKRWYLEFEKNKWKRQVRDPELVTDKVVLQKLAQRGLTMELLMKNPAFRAIARARSYFRKQQTEETLRAYFKKHKDRYGDRLRVARILVAARAQPVVGVGQKIRTLQQGKALAERLWGKAMSGDDFARLVRQNSDDPDVIKENGGVVPLLITAATPGYKDTYHHANSLKPNGIARPFFSAGRGYVIVKLLERKPGFDWETDRDKIREDAANEAYRLWQIAVTRAAKKNPAIFGQ